jgi:hypothetical protein
MVAVAAARINPTVATGLFLLYAAINGLTPVIFWFTRTPRS